MHPLTGVSRGRCRKTLEPEVCVDMEYGKAENREKKRYAKDL
jgi:hypothetical protein